MPGDLMRSHLNKGSFPMAAWVISFLLVTTGASGQAAAENAGVTAATSTATTALKPPPVPALKLPLGNSSFPSTAGVGTRPGTASSGAAQAAEKSETAATANLKFLKEHSGMDGADVTVTTVPDHAQAWVDDRYVGATPLSIQLAPGQHRVFVSGPNSSESFREF